VQLRRFLALIGVVLTAGVAVSAAPARPASGPLTSQRIECTAGYYKNVDGRCVRRPSHDPRGATARCRDGTYSYSLHASGTCSRHGGVARWIHHP